MWPFKSKEFKLGYSNSKLVLNQDYNEIMYNWKRIANKLNIVINPDDLLVDTVIRVADSLDDK